jgi:hypothetical protein
MACRKSDSNVHNRNNMKQANPSAHYSLFISVASPHHFLCGSGLLCICYANLFFFSAKQMWTYKKKIAAIFTMQFHDLIFCYCARGESKKLLQFMALKKICLCCTTFSESHRVTAPAPHQKLCGSSCMRNNGFLLLWFRTFFIFVSIFEYTKIFF